MHAGAENEQARTTKSLDLYNAAFGGFSTPEQIAVREETYGEDLGQTSWTTGPEWRRFADLLDIRKHTNVLEIGSGSGGPSVYLAETRGCDIVGVDVNAMGVENGNRLARTKGLADRVRFVQVQGGASLSFPDESFDAVLSNDVINHIPGRLGVLREWQRVLRPGGRVLFTDALVITGPISAEELALRCAEGFYLFVPVFENERLLAAAGLDVLRIDDLTEATATIAQRRHDARARHLAQQENAEQFERMQRYLSTAATLARERRLSRFMYLAERPRTQN
jgi:SAM-dependent methyltransferase